MANMQSRKDRQDTPSDPTPGDPPVIDAANAELSSDPNLMPAAEPQITEDPVDEGDLEAIDAEGLRWTGRGDRRVITMKDLESLGVTDFKHEGNLVWDADNERTIAIDVVSEDTVAALIKLKDFSLV